MNKLLFISTFLCFSICVNSQNVTMAKAFYKKAQQEYENKNYEEVISLLKKSSEMMDGQINPDMIYLSAMARYHSDLNINTTKSLLNTFLNKAYDDDYRKTEVSDLLVNIETSDNFYENGNRKKHEFLDKNGLKRISYFTVEGFKYWVQYFDNTDQLEQDVYLQFYEDDFVLKRVLNYKKGEIYAIQDYNWKGEVLSLSYYDDLDVELKEMIAEINWKGEKCQYKIPISFNLPKLKWLYDDGELRQKIFYNSEKEITLEVVKNYVTDDNYDKVLFKHSSGKSDNSGFQCFCDLLELHPNGFVKSIKSYCGYNNRFKTNDTYFFNEKGFPVRRESRSRNGKLDVVEIWDWTGNEVQKKYPKKSDW